MPPTMVAGARGVSPSSCSRRSTCPRPRPPEPPQTPRRPPRRERQPAWGPEGEPVEPGREPVDGPLSLSFYQVDDYLTCPLKYKYVHVLRVPIATHHAIVYG